MTLVNGYASVDDVRSQMSDAGDKLDVTLLERAISSASRAVDKYCGRRFWQDATTSVRMYSARDYCSLDIMDVSTQDGFVLEIDKAGNGNWETLSSADYHLEPLNADSDFDAYAWWLVVVDSNRWLPVSRTPLVRVTAQWGWSEIPDGVVEATVLKAVSLFKRKDAPFGIAGFGEFGPVRISRNDPDYADLLRPYRKMVIA